MTPVSRGASCQHRCLWQGNLGSMPNCIARAKAPKSERTLRNEENQGWICRRVAFWVVLSYFKGRRAI